MILSTEKMAVFSEDVAYPRLGQVALLTVFLWCLRLISVQELCKTHHISTAFLDLRQT